MRPGLPARELLVLGAVLAAGLAGTVTATGWRGADAEYLAAQRHTPRLAAAAVERVVRTAPDPAVGRGGGTSARCRPAGDGSLRNPWSCTVRYRSGRTARLAVTVGADGTYLGRYRGGGSAEGCCIELP